MGALSPKTWLGCLGAKETTIQIQIDEQPGLNVYTCGSKISGSTVIYPQSDLSFQTVEISLLGTTETWIHTPRHWPSPTTNTFLQHNLVIEPTSLPEAHIFKAGESYSIPFSFVVPSQLPPSACRHRCADNVREQHMRLPPTLGHWDRDDQAPDTTRIEYAIKAAINLKGSERRLEAFSAIMVLPLVPEDAPILLNPELKRYRLSHTKKIRSGLISSSIGSITLTASQPSPVVLSIDTLETSVSSIRLDLEFSPANTQVVPPSIQSISATLNSETHFSTTPTPFIPDLEIAVERQLCALVSYSTNLKVDLEHPGPLVWQGSQSRMGSGKSPMNQVASLAIPFSVPNSEKMLLLPTFHSCFISRTHTIHFNLVMKPSSTSLSLAIPLQVTAIKGTNASRDELPDYAKVFPQGNDNSPPYENEE